MKYLFSNELVCKILNYLINNINNNVTIDDLSNIFYYDKTYIMKIFKKELGLTISKFINIYRINNSLKYFRDDKTILEIGLLNGFNSQEYFSEIFKKVLGVNPMKYKKYLSFTKDIKRNDEELIRKRLIYIDSIINKTNNYLNNQKPKSLVKILVLKK